MALTGRYAANVTLCQLPPEQFDQIVILKKFQKVLNYVEDTRYGVDVAELLDTKV